MNPESVPALLNGAGAMLRGLAEPGWDRIADAVIHAVRTAPRRVGSSLRATDPTGAPETGSLSVSDSVLKAVLAGAVRLDELCIPSLIDIAVEGPEVKCIRIELTARYGTELHAVAEQVRTTAAAVMADLLGEVAAAKRIDVVVTEIVDGDPVIQ